MRSAVIVAAGNSSRYGEDKLSQDLCGRKLLKVTSDCFVGLCDEIIIVSDGRFCEDIPYAKFVCGGETRSQSVKKGVEAAMGDVVAVHDGARPFVSRRLAERLFAEAELFGSAVPRLPITDTVWRKGDFPDDREKLFTVQTPQVFDREKLLASFRTEGNFTDESTRFFATFGNVHFVDGEAGNVKVTYKGDISQFRIGNGFDVHAFEQGDAVVVGGVRIPYNKRLAGHSDADVLAHAICDAVLSASGNLDIGHQFPDTDERYRGANSIELLKTCVALAKKDGFEVGNVSAVIICQQPKMAPYLGQMSACLAQALEVDQSNVNLSATTTEHLGALGNGDGIAAQAYAVLVKK